MRSPTLASAAVTPAPTATTTPHGSCPAMVGSVLGAMPVPARGWPFGRRYWWRSDPHIPDAFISSTTSPGPGVGSAKFRVDGPVTREHDAAHGVLLQLRCSAPQEFLGVSVKPLLD